MVNTDNILTMLAAQENKEHNQNPTGRTFLKTLSDAAYELQAYRELGTVEELKQMKAELHSYQQLGTVEELQQLKAQSTTMNSVT